MTAETAPSYLDTPLAAQAYDVLHSGAENALGGVAGQSLTITLENRRAISAAEVAETTKSVLIELQFERPAEVHHSIVALTEAEPLTQLFGLAPSDDGEVLGAESLLSLGDIVSTFLDTLGAELTYLQPTPRAWLANLEPIVSDGAGAHVELPPLIAAEGSLYLAEVVLSGDGVRCPVQVIFGEGTEQAVLGLDDAGATAAPADPDEIPMPVPATAASAPQASTPAPSAPPPGAAAASTAMSAPVQPAQFKPLSADSPVSRGHSIDLIKDVPLQISVELGRASLTVREILALGVGSVVELDRLAGEPVDVLVNDRLIGRGEVVIVDESFGVRLTEIYRESNRR